MDARYKIAEAMMRGVGQPMAAFPDQRQDADMSLRGMASDLYQADQRRAQDYRAGISDALMQSWPAELAKSAYGAVTLPGDVYAGKVNPMSDEAVGRAAEFAGLLTLGAGGIPAGKNEMRMGIKAYHGSPHDFDRFDMSKIGTGEGAQAYGHGLYFAGDEGVARSYREGLSKIAGKTKAPLIDGMEAPKFSNTAALKGLENEAEAARLYWDFVKSQPPGSGKSYDALNFGKIKNNELFDAFVENVKSQKAQSPQHGEYYDGILRGSEGVRPRLTDQPIAGRMYEVELNTTPDRLLDWDAPLAQQPDIVRRLTKEAYHGDPSPRLTGKDILEQVFTQVGPARRSEAMREAGIDGIKYLDAGSRVYDATADGMIKNFGSREKALEVAQKRLSDSHYSDRAKWEKTVKSLSAPETRNYVMFDDKLVQILRKYGVATAAALPAAALAELGMSREEAKRSF
jgi:hypothetical protein